MLSAFKSIAMDLNAAGQNPPLMQQFVEEADYG
jgi:hypothetical protein